MKVFIYNCLLLGNLCQNCFCLRPFLWVFAHTDRGLLKRLKKNISLTVTVLHHDNFSA